MDIVTKIRWTCLKEPTLSLFARMNELGDLLDVALQLTFKIADGQNHIKQQIGKLMDFFNGDGNEQQDGLSAIRGLLLKIFCNFSSRQYKNLRALYYWS